MDIAIEKRVGFAESRITTAADVLSVDRN